MKNILIAIAALAFSTSLLQAQVKLDGQFVASKACPALVSIKKGTNPDNATIEAGKSYQLLGKNKDDATHYWLNVPGATPQQRWVAIACGSTDGAQAAAPAAPKQNNVALNTPQGTVKPKPESRGFGGRAPYYAFALSWEPTFCEAMRDKAECKSQTPTSWAASHFTIHGLWPQPRRNVFCGVDRATTALDDQHQWEQLPAPQLSPETKAALDKAMPGTQSKLENHEWIKHGTCYPGGSAEQYFKDGIRLANEVNASPVQALFAANIGKQVSASQIRTAFNQGFGSGAGDKVQVECDKQGRLSGFTLNLRGNIPAGADLRTLLAAGDPARNKCDGGVVDAVH
ncbi:MAG: ribonuclease [Alphaproteobacteria bacterium]|nr:ribonuclease [Alphaproteobacteria bacterium]